MKGLFNINSRFGHMLYQFGQLILLSLYWLLFSLPVFTWGASACAMFTCCRKLLEGSEGKLFSSFFRAFKDNFKQGCIMGLGITGFLILVVYCLLLALSINLFSGTVGVLGGILYGVVVGAVLVYFHYVMCYIARFQDPLKTVLRNCVYLMLVHFDTTLRLGVQLAIVGAAFYLLELIRYLPILVLLLPGVYSMLTADPLERKVFRQYLPKDAPDSEEE